MTSGPDGPVRIIGIDDRAGWQAAAAQGLPMQAWGFAAGLARDGWQPELAVVTAGGARMLLPFHRRMWRGQVDVASLPGLSGALITPGSPAPLAAWSDFARAQGWVAGYVQLSVPNAELIPDPPDRLARHNALFVFDLQSWSIDHSVSVNMRHSLREGVRQGAALETDAGAIAGSFADLHRQTLARSGDRPAFSDAVLAEWFGAEEAVAFAARLQGRIVAAQLGWRRGDWADLHLAGADDAGRPMQGWLIWQALLALKAAGVRWVNIGGYGREGDGLHRMKARLGATQHGLRAVLQVYDPIRFADMCAAAGVAPEGGYFPPYRAAGPG